METQPKKDANEDQSFTPHLPNHIMIEILSRLPIKTLMAIKSVSKSWLNLVSRDTHFAKLHHHRSQPEILLRSFAVRQRSGNLQLATLQFENNVPRPKLNILIDLPEFSVRRDYTIDLNSQYRQRSRLAFVNSCNGLVCFRNINRIHGDLSYAVICNPVTDEFITVPPPPRAALQQHCCNYGLGFSRKENRYKVLMVSGWHERIAEICTFENGSLWRNLRDCSLMGYNFSSSADVIYVFLEGKLHFHPSYSDGGDIYCFDFEDEQFGKVPLPPPSSCSENCIGVLRGCLSLSRFEIDRTIGIWMMKEYGVEDSWIKAYLVGNPCFSYLPIPVVYRGNGEILMSIAVL